MVYQTPFIKSTLITNKSTSLKPTIMKTPTSSQINNSITKLQNDLISKNLSIKPKIKTNSSSSNNTAQETTSYLDLVFKSNPLLLPFNYLSNMFQRDYNKVDTSLDGLLPGGVTNTEALLTNITNQNKLLSQVAEAQNTYNTLKNVTGAVETSSSNINDVLDKIKPLAYATLGIIALTQIGKLIK